MVETPHPLVASFTYHPSCSPFTVSAENYKANQDTSSAKCEYLAMGALVFSDSSSSVSRILLIQRSASDSMPNLWEIPGGGVDEDDESILYAVARELWEEAALTAVSIGPLIGNPHFFKSRSGKQVCRFNFLVEAKSTEGAMDVMLDPKEHQNFVWASEEEVRARKVGNLELEFTTKESEAIILEAFQTKRERKEMLESS